MKRNLNSVPNLINSRYLAPGLAALALFGAGCGDSDQSGNRPITLPTQTPSIPSDGPRQTSLERPGPKGASGQALAASIAGISRNVRGQSNVPSTFCENTDERPQRMFGEKPARLIVNTLCQPPLGEPASVYKGANFDSQKLGKVTDGDIVEAECIDPDGQSTTNVLGPESASETWVRISKGDTTGFISEVNLAYVNDSDFREC